MKNLKIILLHFEHIAEQRARSLIWLLVTAINPIIYIIFWSGTSDKSQLPRIITYYVLMTIMGAFLMSHIEGDIAVNDIQYGQLTSYLVKPLSYYWKKLYEELPYRVLQGFFGTVFLVVLIKIFKLSIQITSSPTIFAMAVCVMIMGFFLAYTFKVLLGLLAFWFTDVDGLFHLAEILIILFAGYIMPLDMMPTSWYKTAQALPFSSMIYYPIVVLQGRLDWGQISLILIKQVVWLVLFLVIYLIIWRKGIKKFTALGQ